MAAAFDINNRSTWAWTYNEDRSGDAYLLSPDDAGAFYQMQDGKQVLQKCPAGMIFDPITTPGPVCGYAHDVDEALVYQWAVTHGQVTDQR